MRRRLPRFAAALVSVLGLMLAAAVAAAQGGADLPFVDASGFVTRALKYSDAVQVLGEPTVSELLRRDPNDRDASVHHFAYPERGVGFTIAAADRPKADPPLASMRVQRTPDGLHVGQPEADLRALVAARYRLLLDKVSRGRGALLLTDRDDRTRRVLRVDLKDGTVRQVEFMLGDRLADDALLPRKPWLSRRTRSLLVELLAILIVGSVVAGVAWVWRRLRRTGVITQAGADGLRRGSAALLVLGGVAGIVLGVSALRDGGWAVLFGLVLVGGGLFGLGAGAALWIGPWRRR